jgi:hypothetical protein
VRGLVYCLVMTRGNEFRGGKGSVEAQGGGARSGERKVNGAAVHKLTKAAIPDVFIPVTSEEHV